MVFEHKRQVRYYETDMMGVVHHSNYIRWFEEARIEFMRDIGLSYKTMEEEGVQIPVVSINCKYKKPALFDDSVIILSSVKKYNGIVIELEYKVINEKNGEELATGESSHCFVDRERFKPISLKVNRPEMHEKFLKAAE